MAPIAVKAPTGVKPTTAPYNDKSMKRGRSVRRSSTQRRPQQLSPHFAQTTQGQQDQDEDEDEDATISDHPRLQMYRRRERQSYINPRQHMLHLPDSARPATSRSHKRDWNHHRDRSRSPSFSKKLPPSDSLSQQPHAESYSSLGTSSMGMTSEEFEALPPTIQRKYFSTLERLRFAHTTCCAGHSDQSLGEYHSTSSLASEEDITLASDHLHRVRPNSARFYPNQADYFYGRPVDSGDRQAHTSHSNYKSIILDATDEAFVKINKRQSQLSRSRNYLDEHHSPALYSTMSSSHNDGFTQSPAMESGVDSITESFRWLEEGEDLDLRLCLDDETQPNPKQGKKKRVPFPRHLSISKLSFGRPSVQLSRPGTRGAALASPALSEQFVLSSTPNPSGHFRRRSRAMSLISPNKGQMSDDSTLVDQAPSHYQDPEARMKLRVYLASPHKFDEAIEFGFPSYDMQGGETSHVRSFSRQGSSDRMHNLTSDDVESLISDPASPTDMASPRTPMSMDHLSVEHSPHLPHEGAWPANYAQAPASSREMTLRMTLTRPDLRADEEQMYGWQKPSSAKSQANNGSAQPRSYARATTTKDSIEKQFAAFDQDNASADNSMVKRFWNRVRRS
ncbi:hypothetical protein FP744_10006003 [Trichoderma asperellum]|nr:hypothetical protein LI328DRAFT_149766 [Trichoderma asperelloides]